MSSMERSQKVSARLQVTLVKMYRLLALPWGLAALLQAPNRTLCHTYTAPRAIPMLFSSFLASSFAPVSSVFQTSAPCGAFSTTL